MKSAGRVGLSVAALVALAGCSAGSLERAAVADAGCASPMGSAAPPPASDGGPPSSSDGGSAGVFDATGPAVFVDGAVLGPTYTYAESMSVTGAQGTQSVACDRAEPLVLSGCGCAVNGGSLVSSGASAVDGGVANVWSCVGTPDVPAKGATIIAWIECRRIYF